MNLWSVSLVSPTGVVAAIKFLVVRYGALPKHTCGWVDYLAGIKNQVKQHSDYLDFVKKHPETKNWKLDCDIVEFNEKGVSFAL